MKAPKPINMLKFLVECGGWEQITGSKKSERKNYIFLENTKSLNLPVEWITAFLFQDLQLKDVHCKFPKAINSFVNALNKSKIHRERFIKLKKYTNDECRLIIDIFETAGLFRNPNNVDTFLAVTFHDFPLKKSFLEICFKFLLKTPLKTVIDANNDKKKIKTEIRNFRVKRLQEFISTRSFF